MSNPATNQMLAGLAVRYPEKTFYLGQVFNDTTNSPLTNGHLLVIPIRHEPSFLSLTPDERTAALELLLQARLKLDSEFHPDGYNIGINVGEAAGQTVMHAHVHLIPRYAGDVPDPRGGVRFVIPEKANYWQAHANTNPDSK